MSQGYVTQAVTVGTTAVDVLAGISPVGGGKVSVAVVQCVTAGGSGHVVNAGDASSAAGYPIPSTGFAIELGDDAGDELWVIADQASRAFRVLVTNAVAD